MTRLRPFAIACAIAMLCPALASAQVGHPPGRSPYRDIPKGHTLTGFAGLFGGSGGRFGIAPHDGTVFGLRYDIRTASPIHIAISRIVATRCARKRRGTGPPVTWMMLWTARSAT